MVSSNASVLIQTPRFCLDCSGLNPAAWWTGSFGAQIPCPSAPSPRGRVTASRRSGHRGQLALAIEAGPGGGIAGGSRRLFTASLNLEIRDTCVLVRPHENQRMVVILSKSVALDARRLQDISGAEIDFDCGSVQLAHTEASNLRNAGDAEFEGNPDMLDIISLRRVTSKATLDPRVTGEGVVAPNRRSVHDVDLDFEIDHLVTTLTAHGTRMLMAAGRSIIWCNGKQPEISHAASEPSPTSGPAVENDQHLQGRAHIRLLGSGFAIDSHDSPLDNRGIGGHELSVAVDLCDVVVERTYEKSTRCSPLSRSLLPHVKCRYSSPVRNL